MSQPPAAGPSTSDPGDLLPPVQPPDAGFFVQLFLIPLVIVAIIVAIWLMFSWIARHGNSPEELVRDLQQLNKDSWRKAYMLTNMLRDPQYDELKSDTELCGQLANLLQSELAAAKMDEHRVRLRVFLCRALGEFRVPTGLPALAAAATTERSPAELDVRYAALESLAVLGQKSNLGAETLRDAPGIVAAAVAAARDRGDVPSLHDRGELRSTAAFALGVMGGPEALDQLARMLELDEPYPNARYNAATGLARHGDLRATRVLLEMLDPSNPLAVRGEESDSQRELKRGLVLINGLRATRELALAQPTADLQSLRVAVESLIDSDLPRHVRYEAREALNAFPQPSDLPPAPAAPAAGAAAPSSTSTFSHPGWERHLDVTALARDAMRGGRWNCC